MWNMTVSSSFTGWSSVHLSTLLHFCGGRFKSSSVETRPFIPLTPQVFKYLTDTTGVTSTEQRGSLAAWRAANASPCHLPRGCEPWALWEWTFNILFTCHISKLHATGEGNNWGPTTCLYPLPFLTREQPHHRVNPPACKCVSGMWAAMREEEGKPSELGRRRVISVYGRTQTYPSITPNNGHRLHIRNSLNAGRVWALVIPAHLESCSSILLTIRWM